MNEDDKGGTRFTLTSSKKKKQEKLDSVCLKDAARFSLTNN